MAGAIWAQSLDGVIGDGETMPWHLPEDLRHFKETTHGHPVVMGRRTWESFPKKVRPLPGRRNIILSSKEPGDWSAGAEVADSLPEPLDGWVIGGAGVYARTIDQLERLEITLVDARVAPSLGGSAVRAPAIPTGFRIASDSGWRASEEGELHYGEGEEPLRFRFLSYRRDY